jgi:hypothetical protein
MLADYHYAYFFGAILFVAAWGVLYALGKSHRKQMLWGSALSAPFALTGFLFMPEYWEPPSLFDLDAKIGIGIEDVVWSAAVGGIASAVVEWIFGSRLAPVRRNVTRPYRWAPLILILSAIVLLELFYPKTSIDNMIAAFCLGAINLCLIRNDLTWPAIRGGLVFAVVYMLLFAFFLVFYPDFIERYYTLENLWGPDIVGIPVEEFCFAASGGAVWTVFYEYYHGYKFVQA